KIIFQPMTTSELSALQHDLRQLLPDQGIPAVLAALKKVLPETAPKYSAVFQLETRLNMANRDKVRGTVSNEELEIAYNRISSDLFDLIDALVPEDFTVNTATHKSGSILYKIPHTMEVAHEQRCLVRLAFEEDVIVQNIELGGAVLEAIRVAEVMEVELVDPNDQAAFTIRALNSAEQFIEKGDYTEWIFFVKPLRTGELPLALRVSVIEVLSGKERKKEIVLEEVIHVVAKADETDLYDESDTFKNAGYSFSYSLVAAPETKKVPNEAPAPSGTGRKVASALVAFVVAAAGIWALGNQLHWWTTPPPVIEPDPISQKEEVAWQRAQRQGTASAYQQYLKEHPAGQYKSVALHTLDSLRRLAPIPLDTSILRLLREDSLEDAALRHSAVDDRPTKTNNPRPTRITVPARPTQTTRPGAPTTSTKPVTPAPSTPLPTPPVPEDPLGRNRKSGFQMVAVSGGSFTMGDERGRRDECPHPMSVNGFHLGKYEITQADWKEVMGSRPSFKQGCEECPVEQVSWNDIQEFLRRASLLKGKRFRLPTEAEWEFAARGGKQSQNLRYAGNDSPNAVAHFNNLQEYTFPVGTRRPNELGIFDMSGNVREWCRDLYLVYPNCKGKNKNEYIVRGGSWASRKDALAVWARDHEQAHRRNSGLGFRIVQE
ncbi:MAG: SUMF1/EgtB/PvdO family nonheme iron enzyme, partial [Saprospiraceae bacterium]